MAAQRCPRCGLVNPSSAKRCDCGRSFVDGTLGEALVRPLSPEERIAQARARTLRHVALVGGAVMLVGSMVGIHYADDLSLLVIGVLSPIVFIGLMLLIASVIVKRS